ncbi:MAG: hypothetical protein A2086_13965 [Spirochaetes bacterium GWD1_27_9]|nr:MAG: hypothetical protein A2Z98_14915 [Spirochaetes bacterium GWB1_27_13]OHD24551.1 MAG: hypothetical protein A2Y34_18955 [Spirochaetes bacterium GWC1_27_15]OHD38282.1 MAG: hypothetical protein A2086_13965 [Spirochaetes bacterium GWD1_27_9]
MRIGIDVDSGERPFEELVQGAIKSSKLYPSVTIFLIGKSDRIRNTFANIESLNNIFLVDAKETILMDESPILALKKKREATVFIGTRMLKNNSIDVFFSPGNTGATVAASVLTLGTIHGIKKPSLATFFPRIGGGETLILDVGANPESNAETLFHNAIMGLSYYKILCEKEEPTLGLLNMGAEFGKGNTNIKKAFYYLSSIPSFIGNVEGYNILNGSVDVVVCDGFTGNSILKFAEAFKDLFSSTLKEVFLGKQKNNESKSFLSYTLNLFGFYKEKKKLIYEKITPKFFGSAPLLGVNGTVLVGHGMCTERDVMNSVDLAYKLYQDKFLRRLMVSVKKLQKK